MIPSSNFKRSYYVLEYTFLPNLGEIDGGEGVRINQNMSKIGRNYVGKWCIFNGTYLRNR